MPTEIAAIVTTQMIVIAIERLGHDPLRAVGALLMELPGLPDRLRPRTSNVCLAYRRRPPDDAWTYLQRAADREAQQADQLGGVSASAPMNSAPPSCPTPDSLRDPRKNFGAPRPVFERHLPARSRRWCFAAWRQSWRVPDVYPSPDSRS
jgi:hypothetical protein